MSRRQFLKDNRTEIDRYIRDRVPNIGSLNDQDRWDWVMNDEGLYLWAKRSGVNVE